MMLVEFLKTVAGKQRLNLEAFKCTGIAVGSRDLTALLYWQGGSLAKTGMLAQGSYRVN